MKEYVISGHSGSTGETFTVPQNISLVFYAELGETCYVPNDKTSLDIVINSMSHLTTYQAGKEVNNYEISFMENHMFEGISEIKRNQYGIQNYNFFYPKRDAEGFIKLKEICDSFKNVDQNIKLYCVFCRGSQREFKDEYGDFQNMDVDQLFLNETFDFDEIPDTSNSHKIPDTTNSQSQYNNKNNELDSFDFDSSLFGGKRKSRRRLKRRKTIRQKMIRRKTIRRQKSKRRRNI